MLADPVTRVPKEVLSSYGMADLVLFSGQSNAPQELAEIKVDAALNIER